VTRPHFHLSKEGGEERYCQTCLAESLAPMTNHDAHERTCKATDAFALEFICYELGFHHHICFEGVEIPLVKCSLAKEERMAER
jgi:hypothetical protein